MNENQEENRKEALRGNELGSEECRSEQRSLGPKVEGGVGKGL